MRDTAIAAGRVCLAVIFIVSGITKFFGLPGTAAYIAAKGLPLAGVLALLTALTEFALGVAVALGFQTRVAASFLAAFTALATVLFHDFWNMAGEEQATNMTHAMKNLAIVGGFLVLAATGAGRHSMDEGGALDL